MSILSLLVSFLINIYPPPTYAPGASSFLCDEKPLEATIYNNQEGGYSIVKPLERIDAGGFVVLNWGELKLMLPRTFNVEETSFTDGKWWWSYKESGEPLLRLRKRGGDIQNFKCAIKSN